MKYKVGSKVKYDSGDWLFQGTVTAVMENPISPSYRLSVDQMIKNNCKFSITQFEFELEADSESDVDKDQLRWENLENEYFRKYLALQKNETLPKAADTAPVEVSVSIPEPKPVPVQVSEPKPVLIPEPKHKPEPVQAPNLYPETEAKIILEPERQLQPENVEPEQPTKQLPPRSKRNEAWEKNLNSYLKGDRSHIVHVWMSQNRKQYQAGKLKDEQIKKLKEVNFPFESSRKKTAEIKVEQTPPTPAIETSKRKTGDSWNKNFELYKNGVKNSSIYNWLGDIRKQYKAGDLPKDKFELLQAINFPFEARPRKVKEPKEETSEQKSTHSWIENYELFRKGVRSSAIFAWISQNRRQYKKGALNAEHHEMLKRIQFPFETKKIITPKK